MPKVKRSTPWMSSVPIAPKRSPTVAMRSPCARERPVSPPIQMKAKKSRANISGAPNFRAASARKGEISITATTLMVPPMNEPKADIPSAGPARPWRAIWYPSMPGRTPITVPMKAPRKTARRFPGVRAMANPWNRAPMVSKVTPYSGPVLPAPGQRDHAGGEGNLQQDPEKDERDDRRHQRDGDARPPGAALHPAELHKEHGVA